MTSEPAGEGQDDRLVLYRVLGFDPDRQSWSQGMSRTTYSKRGGKPIELFVARSEGRWYRDDDGSRISVVSHRPGDEEEFGRLWTWTPRNPYMATSRGRRGATMEDRSERLPDPLDVEWAPATFLVDGVETAFEVCDLGEGIWGAIGRLPDVDLTLDSRGVPQTDVQLVRIEEGERLFPKVPELGEVLAAVAADLDSRFARVPFRRIRRWGDYWALSGIEREHVERLAERYGLSLRQREQLEAHWIGRIDSELSETLERLHQRSHHFMRPMRIRRLLRWNWLFQLWFNTFGPGARTWFGNRYATIRPHTFRIRWRP